MPIGTVKFFNASKGYGFIAPEGGGADSFVHISAVERAGMTTLTENQRVSYEVETDNRGKQSATNLTDAWVAKEDLLTFEGLIEEVLPDGRFRVLLDNQHKVIAYTAGRMRRFRIRTVLGDRVHVEMTPYDLEKGRLIYREPTPGGGGPRRSFRR